MFRLAVDIATLDLLPSDDAEPQIKQAKRMLGQRLTWLFDNEKLPKRLKDLASIVKDDGNDAAHRGTVDKKSAEELVEFTERLLTELYTEPIKITSAMNRRSTARKERENQERP